MNILDRIFAEPELRAHPPVLVDVGAAGGVHPVWRRIARYAIGVCFEPDAREAGPLDKGQRAFRQLIFCKGIAVPTSSVAGNQLLYLTRFPQCSSTLRPSASALSEWEFAKLFDVIETRAFPATTITDALTEHGIERIDWLKCDTQGLDLKLYLSISESWRARTLAVEFEPGVIDAYEGEDKLGDVLAAMEHEPYWLAEMRVNQTPRGNATFLTENLGSKAMRWYRRLGPGAPAWVNLRFLRDMQRAPEQLDRRALLLAWVFATTTGQHGYALTIAEMGRRRFPGDLWAAMSAASRRALRLALLRGFPGYFWERLVRSRE